MALPLDITSKFRQLSSSMGLAVRKDAESDMPADLLMFENACGDTSPVMKTPASPVKANCSDVSLCSSDLHDFDSDSEDDEQNINRPWRPRPSPPFSGKGVVNKDGQGVGQMRQVGIGGGMKYFGCLKGVTKRLNVNRMGHKSIICIQGGGGWNVLPSQNILIHSLPSHYCWQLPKSILHLSLSVYYSVIADIGRWYIFHSRMAISGHILHWIQCGFNPL